MACAARPLSTPRISTVSTVSSRASRPTRTPTAPGGRPAQQAFTFLSELPARERRRQPRTRQPYLRGRTAPTGRAQLVLPFSPKRRQEWLFPPGAPALDSPPPPAPPHPH